MTSRRKLHRRRRSGAPRPIVLSHADSDTPTAVAAVAAVRSKPRVVTINVGGAVFTTNSSTIRPLLRSLSLSTTAPGSAKTFAPASTATATATVSAAAAASAAPSCAGGRAVSPASTADIEDDDDAVTSASEYFVDRDGTHFRHILNYLRQLQLADADANDTVSLSLPDNDLSLHRHLLLESRYYGLTGLTRQLSDAIDAWPVPVQCLFASQNTTSSATTAAGDSAANDVESVGGSGCARNGSGGGSGGSAGGCGGRGKNLQCELCGLRGTCASTADGSQTTMLASVPSSTSDAVVATAALSRDSLTTTAMEAAALGKTAVMAKTLTTTATTVPSTPPLKYSRDNVFTWSEIAQHNTSASCWLVVRNVVYDCTTFLAQHPAGERAILLHAGQDATDDFDFHSKSAQQRWRAFKIGHVAGHAPGSFCVIM